MLGDSSIQLTQDTSCYQFLAFYLRTVNAPGLKNINDGKYKPTWTSLETRPLPDWYNDGKIGIFLHWGVYSVPSFVDVGNEGLGEWFWFYWKGPLQNGIKHRKNKESALKFIAKNYPPEFQYTDFAPQFKAEFFEPDKWAKLFESSGARYVVLTSKHHEGFPLWPSRWAWNWNAMDNGPHRDLVGDLSKSVKKRGLKFGLYYSLYEWFNPLYLEDKRNGFRTQTYIEKKMMPEMRDMVLRYKPDLVWTDGDWDAPCSYWNCTQFLAWLYNDSPVRDTVVTNDRWGRDVRCKHGGFWTCHDRWIPEKGADRKWENCMTIDKESWGFRRNADVHDYFTMDELLEILAETVSKGGNLLMNIGPTADGRITPLFQERLLQLGSWLKVNGEAIYGTHQWITSKDHVTKGVWYTSKLTNGVLNVYAIVMDILAEWKGVITLTSLSPSHVSRLTKVTWLGYNGTVRWRFNQGLQIYLPRLLPNEMPCDWAWAFRIDNFEMLKMQETNASQ